MIKRISQQNFLTTPCVTNKPWSLCNCLNDDLVLLEQTGSMGEDIPVALDYLDYYGTTPFLNRDCNIALEQQEDDQVIYREGQNISGFFYPETDPKNPDGTYKRLIYSQIRATFYNNFRNPIQAFGMENIDFPLSKTERYISDFFREFSIPRQYFGDRLTEKSVQVFDNTLDDNVTMRDDGYGNLIASSNLFSKIQEIGPFNQLVNSGSIEIGCPPPLLTIPYPVTQLTGSLTASISGGFAVAPYEVNLSWVDDSLDEDGFLIYRSLTTNGSTWTPYSQVGAATTNATTYMDIITSTIASASYYVSAYNLVGTATGSNIVYVGS